MSRQIKGQRYKQRRRHINRKINGQRYREREKKQKDGETVGVADIKTEKRTHRHKQTEDKQTYRNTLSQTDGQISKHTGRDIERKQMIILVKISHID
jgi:hypothetical protein